MSLVRVRIPDPSPEQRRRGIELVLQNVAKNGVTSVQDNSAWRILRFTSSSKRTANLPCASRSGCRSICRSMSYRTCRRRRHQGSLAEDRRAQSRYGWRSRLAHGRNAGAIFRRSFHHRNPHYDPEKLRVMAIERDKAGFQLNFHAIGDRANRIALDVFEAVLKANGPRDRRDRIEHAQVVEPMDFVRFGQLKVIASMQPSHQTTDMRWAEDRIGPQRIKGAYAWSTMLKNGVRLAFGTDYSVEVISPFRGCTLALLANARWRSEKRLEPREKISLDDCLRAYTSGSAYAEFEEGKKVS